MSQAVEAYRGITATEEFKYYEILRARTKHDEAQALNNAQRQGMEKMIIMALQSNAHPTVIETMQKGAGITESRLAELREQAQME